MNTDSLVVREQPYDVVFWFAYSANVFLLMAISLLFRYSEFVEQIGGEEDWLGWIVGVGTIGAILLRSVQATAIDRFGAIWVWGLCLIGMAGSALAHLWIDHLGWQVFVVRLCLHTSWAGVMGAWLSFVSLRVRENRLAEIVGVVGTSGFVGMAIGPALGDWLFSGSAPHEQKVASMFIVTAIITMFAFGCALMAGWLARHEPRNLAPNGSSMIQLLRNYHPGFLLVVAATMGLMISLPGNFLRPFAKSLQIEQIMFFFVTYNFVAFISRLYLRKAPARYGLRTMLVVGLLFMAVSMLLFLMVDTTWKLIFPAIAGGLGHSALFPSVIAGGSLSFPKENRGTATSLILAFYDVGILLGSPLVGQILVYARARSLPDYPIMFSTICVLIGLVLIGVFIFYVHDDGKQLKRRGHSSKGN